MSYEEIEQQAFKHHRPSARSFGRQVYDIQQARIAELEAERDLMLFMAEVQFNVFWNGGWYQMPMPIKPTEGSE
jgi:hypothetical protein